MSPEEREYLMHWIGIIVQRNGLSTWERTFCASLLVRSKREGFIPSMRQAHVMRRIVDHYRAEMLRDEAPSDPEESPE